MLLFCFHHRLDGEWNTFTSSELFSWMNKSFFFYWISTRTKTIHFILKTLIFFCVANLLHLDYLRFIPLHYTIFLIDFEMNLRLAALLPFAIINSSSTNPTPLGFSILHSTLSSLLNSFPRNTPDSHQNVCLRKLHFCHHSFDCSLFHFIPSSPWFLLLLTTAMLYTNFYSPISFSRQALFSPIRKSRGHSAKLLW